MSDHRDIKPANDRFEIEVSFKPEAMEALLDAARVLRVIDRLSEPMRAFLNTATGTDAVQRGRSLDALAMLAGATWTGEGEDPFELERAALHARLR